MKKDFWYFAQFHLPWMRLIALYPFMHRDRFTSNVGLSQVSTFTCNTHTHMLVCSTRQRKMTTNDHSKWSTSLRYRVDADKASMIYGSWQQQSRVWPLQQFAWEELFVRIWRMPRFPGCLGRADSVLRFECGVISLSCPRPVKGLYWKQS